MMATATQTFNHLFYQEDKTWLSALNFYEDELREMGHLLGQVLPNHTHSPEFVAWTKYFQEQFEKQTENIESIKKSIQQQLDLQVYEKQFRKLLEEQVSPENHSFIRNQIFAFEKLFLAIKHEFYKFLEKYFI